MIWKCIGSSLRSATISGRNPGVISKDPAEQQEDPGDKTVFLQYCPDWFYGGGENDNIRLYEYNV